MGPAGGSSGASGGGGGGEGGAGNGRRPRCRIHARVSGKVQGVFFRQALRAEATMAGAGGWVRNLDDGRVEAVVEGDADVVSRIAGWCRHGPAGARVSGLEVEDEAPTGEFSGFEVRY